jgi:hypothetical protein
MIVLSQPVPPAGARSEYDGVGPVQCGGKRPLEIAESRLASGVPHTIELLLGPHDANRIVPGLR